MRSPNVLVIIIIIITIIIMLSSAIANLCEVTMLTMMTNISILGLQVYQGLYQASQLMLINLQIRN